ncbi:DUF5690 family protein [Siphonobacter sp. SORGH_AS_0500]|uniref:DUF5690 family protein n=1 Tax=Siphonobacter sp. SORGH_AS_0500 TaxID=1864824 RepID=UPI002857D3FF|nr:DUF5690 family protein [Siphonobacter sp. SORGH_AS_0500]MDR6197753.1 MFS family permease [Siphonobacter sp. SORGH_AS_0500]
MKDSFLSKHPWLLTLLAGLAAFGTYSCMYAFRKAFAAGTYNHLTLAGIDYKVWLVFAQILGYALSKFYGIKFVSEIKTHQRIQAILGFIGFSWLALAGFALCPAPYNLFFMFLNGLPLGMIWGLVFSFLEGRKNTEFMGAVMATSMIFASGFVKTVALQLRHLTGFSEFWIPFLTGLVFLLPLILCVYLLSLIPPPSAEDQKLRTQRQPMDAEARRKFLRYFFPGIVLTIFIYVQLTVVGDLRDNFEIEIWKTLGYTGSSHIYTQVDMLVSLVVLVVLSLLILVKNNLKAFVYMHGLIIGSFLLIGLSTWLFNSHQLSLTVWMTTAGVGLYMAYVPYNALFFERMIATFRYQSNVAFVMYLADSMGYLASIGILFVHEFSDLSISWGQFYNRSLIGISIMGSLSALFSLLYFQKKYAKSRHESVPSLTSVTT